MAENRNNDEWIAALSKPGPEQEAALSDLRTIVARGLPYALSKWLSRSDPQLEALVEETTQETLLRVLSHLNTFEGRSKFIGHFIRRGAGSRTKGKHEQLCIHSKFSFQILV